MEQNHQHTRLPVDPLSHAEAAEAFAALGSEVRIAILRSLVRAGDAGLPVGALQKRLAIAASTLSHPVAPSPILFPRGDASWRHRHLDENG